MKIDWKKVAKSPAYISMKACVAEEAKRCAKWKQKPDSRYQEAFNFAMNRAKHYAHHLNKTFIEVLEIWEAKRTYNFMNYYSDHNLPKFHSNRKENWGLRRNLKSIKSDGFYKKNKRRKADRIKQIIGYFQSRNPKRTGRKARWTIHRKHSVKRMREYEAKRNL